MKHLTPTHAAVVDGRTIFQRTVKLVDGSVNLLKRSIDNQKLGKRREWRAGAYKGMPLYSLTLEERATCDRGCEAWRVCYGNNMPFAHRFSVADGGAALQERLTVELDRLDTLHPDGYSIRLHILGDFFSVDYVKWWETQLDNRPLLHIYGYTHRQGEIRGEIDRVWGRYGARFNIMQSDGRAGLRPIALLETTEGADKLPVCPQQTGRAEGCLDCGLCTLPNVKGVKFKVH